MAFFDMPLEELQSYRPKRDEPEDFDRFWTTTVEEARNAGVGESARFDPVDSGLSLVETWDVTFPGYDGQPVKGWFTTPANRGGARLPCVVEYIGYGGGRGFPTDWLVWPVAGYAYFVMDTRGQGSTWQKGDTADLAPLGTGPAIPGFMTRGILDPRTYYYRRLITDAVRAIDAVTAHPAVDTERIAVTGASQGGGLALAAAGLSHAVKVAMPNVPFLCHYRRAVAIIDNHPYGEISNYLKVHRDQVDTAFTTLSYFDGLNFAARADAEALFSAGLMDTICPPSTVFAAYNHYAGTKEMRVYEFNNHEGGQDYQVQEQLRFLRDRWPVERDSR